MARNVFIVIVLVAAVGFIGYVYYAKPHGRGARSEPVSGVGAPAAKPVEQKPALELTPIATRGVDVGGEEVATAVFQNGLEGYDGCRIEPDGDVFKIVANDSGSWGAKVRFDGLAERLRCDNPRIVSARLEVFYLKEWCTAYRYDVHCDDASADGVQCGKIAIFGERTGSDKATPNQSFVAWPLPPELVQKWLAEPTANKGLRLYIGSAELLEADKGGGKMIVFIGNATHLARYRPRLIVEYSGDIRPEAPHWVTDLADRQVGGRFVLRWDAPQHPNARIDIECNTGLGWRALASDLSADARQYEWTAPRSGNARFRIRTRIGSRASNWRESGEIRFVAQSVPFRLGALPTVLKLRRDAPLEYVPEPAASIELARNEEEAVQIVIDRADRELKNVRVSVSDLVTDTGARIPSNKVSVWPVGYVFTKPSGRYLTERDGWFADVLLEKRQFDVEPETVQPVWLSFMAVPGTAPGTYNGSIKVSADGGAEVSMPLKVTVWDFELPTRHTLPVIMLGGTNARAYGFDAGSEAAKNLSLRHEELLLEHRITPGWLLSKFTGGNLTLPRNPDGSFDFTDFDKQAERLMSRGVPRFYIAVAPYRGKWGFPAEYSEEWKGEMRAYLKAMCRHLVEKGWLDRAMFYSIDEAPPQEWPSCRMLYRLVKEVEPRLQVFQTLNEPSGARELVDSADIINVNVRQYYQAGIPELQKKGKETWWYVCCWPNENPNLFIDYPGIDPRVLGWMTWKYGMKGFIYWETMWWEKAFDAMGDKKYVDEILSKWQPAGYETYNGDGSLFYPGPDGAILRSVRLENFRDGLEDFEYLAMLKSAFDAGRFAGDTKEQAETLLAVDERICDMQFGYELDGKTMLAARRQIAKLLSASANADPRPKAR